MKKFLLIISVIFIVSASWYFLKFYYDNKKISAWQLVPKNALMVYESEQSAKAWNDFISIPAWNILSKIASIDSLNRQLVFLDGISENKGQIAKLLASRSLIISFHKVSIYKLDYILFIPLDNAEKIKILTNIISKIGSIPGYSSSSRIYQKIPLFELKNKISKSVFTYFIYKGFFIGSFTPYLVEDVVRNASDNYRSGFMINYGSILEIPSVQGDEGNLYFNPHELPALVSTFLDPSVGNEFRSLASFSGTGYFDINFEKNRILLNGTTLASNDTSSTFLSTIADQAPSELIFFNLMPSATAWMIDFTFEDFSAWRREVDRYWEKSREPDLEHKTKFLEKYGILEKDFYNYIGNEMAIANLETGDSRKPEKLILIQLKDTAAMMNFINDLSMRINLSSGDSSYFGELAGNQIRQLNMEEFPAGIFGGLFKGFEDSFYTIIDQYLVIGNSADAVKNFINDQGNDNTWGKSVNYVQYFDNVQKNANLSMFVNVNRAYDLVYNSLNKDWQDFFNKYERQIRQFEIMSIQFVNINNNIYSSFALQHRSTLVANDRSAGFPTGEIVSVEGKIANRPFVVRNHNDKSREVILQDTSGQVYLVSSKGEILWKKQLGNLIRSDLFQLDYFKNGKLQYLFCTNNSLQLVDRNGKDVENFPVMFVDSIKVHWLNVIDYDDSRDYRFIAADSTGRLFLFDKNGKIIEGWKGLDMKGMLVQAPFYLRVHGKDCIVAVLKKGVVNIINRQGKSMKGFPLQLDNPVEGPLFVQPGPDFSRTLFNTVTSNGIVIQFNMEGKIKNKSQLYRPGKKTLYEIVPNLSNDNFVIARLDDNHVTILDRAGVSILDKDLLFTDNLKVQYYNFGTNNELFVFSDAQQEFTYVFNREGKLLNNQPFESSYQVSIVYSEVNNQFSIYSCYGNQLRILSTARP